MKDAFAFWLGVVVALVVVTILWVAGNLTYSIGYSAGYRHGYAEGEDLPKPPAVTSHKRSPEYSGK